MATRASRPVKKMTTEEAKAVALLVAIGQRGAGSEENHFDADKVLLTVVHPLVVRAYSDLAALSGGWYFA